MIGYKSARVAEDIKRQVSYLIRHFRDPRICRQELSVVRVDISKDCSNAKVYVSSLRGFKRAKLGVEALNTSAGRIGGEVSRLIGLRKTPKIKFIADYSIEYSAYLDKLFSEFNNDSVV